MKISNFHKFLCGLFLIIFLGVCTLFGSLWIQAYREHVVFKQQEAKLHNRLEEALKEKKIREEYLERMEHDEEFFEWVVKQRLGYARGDELVFKFEEEGK